MEILTKAEAHILNTAPSYEQVLFTFRTAARNCYQSATDSNNNYEDTERLVKALIKSGHTSTLEFNFIPAQIIGDRNLMGQLTRHRLLSFCLSGDTVIQSFGSSGKKRTIRDLYKWYTTPKYHAAFSQLILRSVDDNNIIVPNKPVKIFFNGNKDVYRVTTESGRSIKATSNHKFKTIDGWVELGNLSVGDKIYVNGKELLDNEDWLRYNYLTLNHTRAEVAKLIGCCEAYVYKAFKKFGIVKPYKDFPNRKPGRGKKGMFTEEQRKEISKRKSGANNKWYKADRNSLTRSGGYSEANAKYGALHNTGKCEFCGNTENLEIHHIDKDSRHNDQDNIKILCRDCHNLWHGLGKNGTFLDKIVSIDYVGVEDVYDIEMESPYHNYVANGFVVHNCIESARYNNYKDGIKVITPADMTEAGYETWRASCIVAESAYLDLLDKGCKPETARSVLPSCLATSIVCGGNIREWRHVFKLRISKHSQVDIRDVMKELLTKFYANYPVFFADQYNKMIEQGTLD